MAYARYGKDSDVYVYEHVDGGYRCERCPRVGSHFHCASASEMVRHLLGHRQRGDRVPDDALNELTAENSDFCASHMNKTVTISLTAEEALVLFEFLTRYSDEGVLRIEHQAEERVLWDVQCVLEPQMDTINNRNYEEEVAAAREAVRDKE